MFAPMSGGAPTECLLAEILLAGGALYLYVAFVVLHVATLLLLAVYGFHRYLMVYLYYRHRGNRVQPAGRLAELPKVCVQLPMYNEQFVARRIIEQACRIDYPRDRLEIQVLDDSTDRTVEIASETVDRLRAKGHNIRYIHRTDRTGFKAGALAHGLGLTDADLCMVFDADFVPPPEILQETIHYFSDPGVGMVQVRWEHLNRDHSLLTKSQAILLDGHFAIEQAARNSSGRFMSFNGTAGLWRRSCIEDAGGWQHDTLTEDLDLSYRAQLRGWRFVFLPTVVSPAELPPEINAFKTQQHRWTKGGAQTARKLLWTVLRSRIPWKVKLEAFFHLTSWTVYIYITLLSLMLLPSLYVRRWESGSDPLLEVLFGVTLFALATCSASVFYLCSQQEIFRRWTDKIKYLPFLMALGIGISLSNTLAALAGLFSEGGEFVRTPKFGVATAHDRSWRQQLLAFGLSRKMILPFVEMAFGVYMVVCMAVCLHEGRVFPNLPFLILFASGYWYVSLTSLATLWRRALSARGRTSSGSVGSMPPTPKPV